MNSKESRNSRSKNWVLTIVILFVSKVIPVAFGIMGTVIYLKTLAPIGIIIVIVSLLADSSVDNDKLERKDE